MPRVTVLMGAFNCADTLDEAMESLVAQTYPHWDLVVCDDASTDATYSKLLEWRDRLPARVTVLRNDTNVKLARTLNRCLERATGELIARMDADDVSAPLRFERQVAHLLARPEVDLVGTAMQRFSDAGPADVVRVPERPTRLSMRRGSPFCHATVMARRHVFDSLRGYLDLPRTVRTEDLDLWFRFFARGFVGHNLPDALYLVREDLAAMRRRSVRNRIDVFRTTVVGYGLLGFPRRWYVYPVLGLAKALVPVRVVAVYRLVQKWQSRPRSGA